MTKDAEAVIGLYRRHALAYVAARGQGLMERAWLDRFVARMPAAPAVLDLGCGAGLPIGAYLMAQGCRVTGVDAAPELIAQARQHLPKARWEVADMRQLDLGQRFDGILAWDSSFHLTPDDQRQLFPALARHAQPGAALMFTSGPRAGTVLGAFQGAPLYHASLDPKETRMLLAQAGFKVLDHVIEDPHCGQHSVWLAQRQGGGRHADI